MLIFRYKTSSMERRGNVIPPIDGKQQRNSLESRPSVQRIAAVREDARVLLESAKKDFDRIDADSYASRIEGRERIAFLARFNRKISKAEPGRVVNLRRTIVDYGDDPEAAAADQSCGLDYVSEADRKETDYHLNISAVSGLIQRLERAGVQVAVGVERVFPDDEE
jgi:hypothetical protein